ncbi:MAG: hypothetical protein ACQCN3_06365 [Candidatus Bathyarchaeia archaeon]|jgi:hypothetical protein
MPWETTTKYIHSGHKPVEDFQQDTLKTVTIDEEAGIQAVMGKPNGQETMEIQSYQFQTDKGWTLQKAQEWFEKHNTKEHICAVLPFVITEKVIDKPLKIRGLAMTAGISRNFNIYTPAELQSFAGKLVNAPVYMEHVAATSAVGKVTQTEWDGHNLLYEAEIYDEETAAKIRKGLIRHVSVGADYESVDLVNGKVPHGLFNAEMSLVAVPGIAETNIQIIEKLAFKEQTLEPTVAGEYLLGFYQDAKAFIPEHFSTVWLDRENGILALMGTPSQQPTSQRAMAIFFSKQKQWDQTKAKDWLSLHPDYMTSVAAQTLQTSRFGVEGLIKKPQEKTIPISQAVKLIEQVLPNSLVQRSWSLGPQRMCQELQRAILKLRRLQDSHEMTASN